MTINTDEKRVAFLQYISTTMISIIGIFTTIIFFMVTNVSKNQAEAAAESLRLKTVQDINVKSVESLNLRVNTLELNYLDYIKTWVDQNYVRKPQK